MRQSLTSQSGTTSASWDASPQGATHSLFGFLERTRPNTFVETRLNGLNGTPNIVTSAVVGFGEDEAGHLYVVQQSGLIRRLFSNDIFGDSFGTSN